MKPISDYMTKRIVYVDRGDTVLEAVDIMRKKGIGAVLINNKKGKLAGIFTERDLLTKVNLHDTEELGSVKVLDVMTSRLKTAAYDDPYIGVLKKMQKSNIRHMPVEQNGEIVGIVSLRDIVRRYEEDLELQLQESHKQLLKNLDDIKKSQKDIEDIKFALDEHAVVSVTDAKGKIIYANDKFCQVSGFLREELVGKDHRIVNSGYHPKEFFQGLWETIQSGKVWKGEVRNKTKDGSFYWVDTTIVPFLAENGEPYQYVSIRTNVSQRKKREEELEALNKDLKSNDKAIRLLFDEKEKQHKKLLDTEEEHIQSEKMATMGTMAAGFAHEIKNPLAIILQSMEKIEKNLNTNGGDKSLPFVNIVKNATDRANTVVSNILKYSRASSVEESPINIFHVIDGAVELMVNSGDFQNVEITKDYDEANYPVLGDTIMLQQVFLDLMTNSRQAMPDGGKISIHVSFNPTKLKSKEAGQYIVEVADTGEGIDSEYIKKIFDPFFTTKEEGKGTGLGLNTVYLIIEKHKGSIKAESKLGKGTKFTIILPATTIQPL